MKRIFSLASVVLGLLFFCNTMAISLASDDLLDLLLASSKGGKKHLLVKENQIPPFTVGQTVYHQNPDGTVKVGKIRKLLDSDTVTIKWKRRDGDLWLFNFPSQIKKHSLARRVTHPLEGQTMHVPAYHYYLKVGEISGVFENNQVEVNYGSHRPRRYYHLSEVSPETLLFEKGWTAEMKTRSGDLLQGIARRQFENGLVEVHWQRKNGSKKHLEFMFSPFAYLSDPPEYHYVHRSRLSFYPNFEEFSLDYFGP